MVLGEALAISANDEKNSIAPYILNGFKVATASIKTARESELKQQEWNRQHAVFVSATSVGADYLESTGAPPSEAVMDILQLNDYSPYTSQDILQSGVFYDWKDYLSFVEQKQKDRLSEDEMGKEQILSEVAIMIDNGDLPFIFVADLEPYKSEEKQAKIENDGQKSINDTKRLTGAIADRDELIKRFARYQIATELVIEKEDEKGSHSRRLQNINIRRLNIALGVNIDTGKILNHAFVQEIKGSNNLLSIEDIKNSEIYQKWYDVLHPVERKKYLEDLEEAGHSAKIAMYSSSFPSEQLSIYEPSETFYDTSDSSLMIKLGKTAVQASKKIVPLAEIMSDTNYQFDTRADANRFREWSQDDCLKYGEWLVRFVPKLNFYSIERASKLHLGPGVYGIQRRFNGSLHNYFSDLGAPQKHARYSYKRYSQDYVVDYIRSVAELYEGKMSEKILRMHYQKMKEEGIKVLSPNTIEKAGEAPIGLLFEIAGFAPKNRKTDAKGCVEGAIRFYHENGRLPHVADINESPYLPSWPTIRRYCGSIGGLHEMSFQAMTELKAA